MPTYVYRCQNCHRDTEIVQRFSDNPLTICPHCGGSLQRLLFPPAIIFKGSGWYSTDHRSPSGNGVPAKEAVAGKQNAGNGDGKESEKSTPLKDTSGAGES